jgi:ABC-type transporter Mla subunit MlaD
MTIAAQVKQTFVSLKSAKATLESLKVRTNVPEAKETFESAEADILEIVKDLQKRINDLEREEPQYKGF